MDVTNGCSLATQGNHALKTIAELLHLKTHKVSKDTVASTWSLTNRKKVAPAPHQCRSNHLSYSDPWCKKESPSCFKSLRLDASKLHSPTLISPRQPPHHRINRLKHCNLRTMPSHTTNPFDLTEFKMTMSWPFRCEETGSETHVLLQSYQSCHTWHSNLICPILFDNCDSLSHCPAFTIPNWIPTSILEHTGSLA